MQEEEEQELILSKKYAPLFKWLSCLDSDELAKVDTVVCTGGRYSQKSFAVGTWSCIAAKDFVHRILYTRYTLVSASDSIIPEFSEKIDLLGAQDDFTVTRDRIVGNFNASKIVFKGIKTGSGNQTANLKSLKGFSVFIVEEAEELPSFDQWDKIKKSIRALDVRNLSVLILNPTLKTHWIYEELFEDRGVSEGFNGVVGNILYIHTDYTDLKREFIPDSIFNDFEDKRLAYEQYEATPKEQRDFVDRRIIKKWRYYKYVVKGGWLENAEGVVFDNWVVGEFDESLPFGFGQDYGYNNDPTTLVKIAVSRKQKRIYVKGCFGKPGLSTDAIFEANLFHSGINHEIVADSAENRLIDELRERGLNMTGAYKPPGSVTAGIKSMQDYEIVIDPGPESIPVVKEFKNYVWHDKKSGVPVDLWNHYIDPIRYYAWPLIKEAEIGMETEMV